VKGIRREAYYPHPPERVWRALTTPALLASWLMESEDFAPVVGRRFRFRTAPKPGFDGVVHCEVLEADPPRRLAYTWAGGGSVRKRPTTVTWTLHPEGSGTRLELEHAGFRGIGGFLLRAMLGGGWGRMVRQSLPAVLDRLAAAGDDLSRVDVSRVVECEDAVVTPR
jgi:uncharacterized protein YndB with AHSA1/START domain